jgi:hypothetical protein
MLTLCAACIYVRCLLPLTPSFVAAAAPLMLCTLLPACLCCRALGCNEPQCVLCQHNSQRRCAVNFCKKYLVNDKMVARCGAGIRVEVVDRANGKVYDGDLPDVFLEVSKCRL